MFLLDKKSMDRSPYGRFWFEPVSMFSSAGVRVNPDTAMRLTAVYGCVRALAESFAILPPILYQKDGRNKEPLTNHWLYKLLAKKPNRYQNGFEWRMMLMGHLALRGNAFCHITANSRGEVVELMPLHPDRVRIEIQPDGNYRYLFTDRNGELFIYLREDVFHLKGLSPDIYLGYNPIELARDAVGIGLSSQAYGARFFENDAKPAGGWIEHPGSFKDKEAKLIFRESWQEMQAGGNRGKTAVLENGMKFHEIGINNADAQFLETRRFTVEDVARIFGVPPHRIGHLEQSTNNNIEHQGLEFVTYTMTPWVTAWEAKVAELLINDDEDLELKFNFAQLLRGDSKARSLFYHNGILDGWMTRNEPRVWEDLEPLPGLDEPLRPLNMMPEAEADTAADAEAVDDEETVNDEGASAPNPKELKPKKRSRK